MTRPLTLARTDYGASEDAGRFAHSFQESARGEVYKYRAA